MLYKFANYDIVAVIKNTGSMLSTLRRSFMNIIIQYGTGVAALPREVLRVMDRATMTDLKLLLLLASEPSLLVGDSLTGCAEGLAAAGGCTPAQAFFKVTLHEIMPGIVSGAIMAFTMSLDDFVISYFVNFILV